MQSLVQVPLLKLELTNTIVLDDDDSSPLELETQATTWREVQVKVIYSDFSHLVQHMQVSSRA